MRRLTLPLILALAATTAACAPNPIVARDPVPAPGPADAYQCDARPLVLNAFGATCRPMPAPPVVSAKG